MSKASQEAVRWAAVVLVLAAGAGVAFWRTRPPGPTVPSVTAGQTLTIQPAAVDFGEVALGETREQTVVLRNQGSRPVRLLQESTACSCLKGEAAHRLIPPGGEGALQLRFTGVSGRRTYRTSFSLVTDEAGPSRYEIPIAAQVKFDVTVEPEVLSFGKIEKGKSRTLEAVVRHAEGKPISVLEVKTGRPEFTFKWTATEDGKSVRIQASARALGPGMASDQAVIVVVPASASPPVLLLSLEGEGDLRAEPPIAVARTRQAGRADDFEIVLVPKSGATFEVHSVQETRGLRVEHRVEALSEGRQKLLIRFLDGPPQGPPVGEFLVKTSVEILPIPWRIQTAN